MTALRLPLAPCLMVVAACRTAAPEVAGPGAPSTTATAGPPAPAVSALASSTPAPRPLAVRNLGGGAVEVRNDGDVPLRVAFDLDIEREVGGRWESTHVSNMLMQTKCFDPKPADGCVTLPPHIAFQPLPWRGWFGCTQCVACRANVPATPGRYRIVARSCEGGDRAESGPISVVRDGEVEGTAPAPSGAPSTPRAVRPDEFGPPEPVMIPVVERICKTAPCSGKLARLWVFQKDNRTQRYLHHGDPTACSDPPSVYFDRDGREIGGIGMRPVQRGSDDERRLNEERARLEAGATPVAELDCTGRTLGPVRR